MNKKEAASLLVSGLAITGGVLSAYFTAGATTAAPLILSEGLKAFGGLGGGIVGNALQKKIIDNHPQEDVLKNGDLTRAIGGAIFKLCGSLAKETSDKYDKKTLEKLAETDLEVWENLIIGGGYEEGYGLRLSNINLDEVSSEKSTQYFNASAETLDEIKALTPQTWQNIIETLCQKQKCSLSKSAKEELSNKLHNEFAAALRKILIADFATDGKAYASMQFRILGEILNYLNEILIYSKQNYELSDSILAIVIDLSKKVDKINQESPRHYSSQNAKNWEKIVDDFNSFRETLNKTYRNTEDILAVVRQILAYQENQSKSPTIMQKFFPSDFPQATRFFTGREDVLENIKTTLEKTERACLHDISGIGKTSAVLKYAEDAEESYDFIFYLKPNDVNYLDEIWKSADKLGFQLPREANPDDKANELRHWLASHQNWLVIFDNVTDVKQMRDFIHHLNNGHFLFTSNLREAENLGKRIEIKKFEDADSRTLLYRRGTNSEMAKFEDAASEDRVAINKIAQEFDGLPLALNICGSFIADGQMSFAEFSHDIFEHQDEWDDYSFTIDGIEYKSFGRVFEKTFQKLITPENESEDAEDKALAIELLLKAVSFLAPNAIPQDILSETLKRFDEQIARFAKNDKAWIDFRPNLTKYDLLQYKPEIKTFETHRLIQKAVEKQFADGEKSDAAEVLAEVLASFFPDIDYKVWEGWGKYIPHHQSFLQITKNLTIENETIAYIHSQTAAYFNAIAQYENAEFYYLKSNKIYEKNENDNKEFLADNYNSLAGIYYSLARYKEAEEFYKKALLIREEILGKNHTSTATTYSDLALFYVAQKEYEKAEHYFKKAIKIFEEILGEEHPWTSRVYSNLSGLYFLQKRHEEAKPLLERDLATCKKVLGENHPETAGSCDSLAFLYNAQGRYEEAEPLYTKAKDIREKVLGENHPDTAASYMNLGAFYYETGKSQEGLELCEKALKIYQNTLPAGHPRIQNCEEWIEIIKDSMGI